MILSRYNGMVKVVDSMDNLYLDDNGVYRDRTKEPYDLVGIWVTEESLNCKVSDNKEIEQISLFDYK